MSFSHLEKSFILLRDSRQWSRDVAVAVQARYDRHDRPDPNNEPQSPEPHRDKRNFVFIADFAPGYTNTTAFVSYFKLTELEYCLLLWCQWPPDREVGDEDDFSVGENTLRGRARSLLLRC
jgi:hypothetical protein